MGTTTAPNEVDVWNSSSPSSSDTPILGSGSTDTPIRQYVWGTYIDEVIQLTTLTTLGAQNVPAGAYYLLQDLLYRAVALTNSAGAIVETYDTDPYAQTIIYTAPGPDGVWFTDDDVGSGFTYGANHIIFCGYRYDPETRLYYVRNRMFLTDTGGVSVGRWLQRDPIGYAGGITLYEYVGGRAVVALDPSGTQEAEPPGTGPLEIAEIIKEVLDALPKLFTIGACARAHHRYVRDMCACGNTYDPANDPMYQALHLVCELSAGNVKRNQLTTAQIMLLYRFMHHQIPNKPPCG